MKRPSQVRAYLQNQHMQVDDAPEDDADDAPRQSYNFAPGYNGIVYRADVPYYGAGTRSHKKGELEVEPTESTESTNEGAEEEQGEVRYKLQTMKWGLIPFWTKRNPDYGSMLKTINCRDDSLIENKGMWTTMKQKKRCIVVAQGFYEWLKKGPKEKVPHFVKRKDGQLMCMAGLWDCVRYEGVTLCGYSLNSVERLLMRRIGSEEETWTYTIITTSSNKQLDFLHDRMPVILDNGSEEIRTWLDPKKSTWSKELQSLLKPFKGELEVYPVSKDVGKVGNNSPTFIIPVASSENKSNIANFFAKGAAKKDTTPAASSKSDNAKVDEVKKEKSVPVKHEPGEYGQTIDHECTEDNAPLPVPSSETKQGTKRELDDMPGDKQPKKFSRTSASPNKTKPTGRSRSATSNNTVSPKKPAAKEKGSQKITSFFGK